MESPEPRAREAPPSGRMSEPTAAAERPGRRGQPDARHRVCDGLRNLFLRLALLVCGPDSQMDGYFPATHEMKSRI